MSIGYVGMGGLHIRDVAMIGALLRCRPGKSVVGPREGVVGPREGVVVISVGGRSISIRSRELFREIEVSL